MRLLIDLQACQSTGSRHRGIGRYSIALLKAMLANAGSHEVHILLSRFFPETIVPLRETLAQYLPARQIHTWGAPGPVAENFDANYWRCRSAEIAREQMLANLRPDMVHVTSLFEGSGDDAVTSIGMNGMHLPTAVTLYDLIPLVHEKKYLVDARQRHWYYRKLQSIARADLLLAISEASRQEGIEYLRLDSERVVNISSAVDAHFQACTHLDTPAFSAMRQRYGLHKPYVMYTGGIDLRKNIDGLIRAFADLPKAMRQRLQLAIVCSVQSSERERLQTLGRQHGLTAQDLILTGFVPDEDLPLLYQACQLFVFPSWHEGFGLPALEAMACGAPVIAANCSSLPEVVGCADALFDPHQQQSITGKMFEVLNDVHFAQRLREHGLRQAKQFSWDSSAKKAIAAFEQQYARRQALAPHSVPVAERKPRLAYCSPLPNAASGIADYSAELIPALAQFYDITLIVDQASVEDAALSAQFVIRSAAWMHEHAYRFDRILYHMGNSPAHAYMFPLFERFRGSLVLHDFFLSDSLAYLDMNGLMPHIWTRALYRSHGYSPLFRQKRVEQHASLIQEFPCSLKLARQADGVIVHSQYSKDLAAHYLGEERASEWKKIPHLRQMPIGMSSENTRNQMRRAARQQLGIAQEDFLVCAFGVLGPTKRNKELIQAWLASNLSKQTHCQLVFVGGQEESQYGRELSALLKSNCRVTGYVDQERFRNYLQAADLAVQLRTGSRGETSGTVIDCMAHSLPLIINKNASMAEIADDLAWRLEDNFSQQDLQLAIEHLYQTPELRRNFAERARAHVIAEHAPQKIAAEYFQAIESFYNELPNARLHQSLRSLAQVEVRDPAQTDWPQLAEHLSQNARCIEPPRTWIDVSAFACAGRLFLDEDRQALQQYLSQVTRQNRRHELLIRCETGWQTARTWAKQHFGLIGDLGAEETCSWRAGDELLEWGDLEALSVSRVELLASWGVHYQRNWSPESISSQ